VRNGLNLESIVHHTRNLIPQTHTPHDTMDDGYEGDLVALARLRRHIFIRADGGDTGGIALLYNFDSNVGII
jgi:hypothetical protein